MPLMTRTRDTRRERSHGRERARTRRASVALVRMKKDPVCAFQTLPLANSQQTIRGGNLGLGRVPRPGASTSRLSSRRGGDLSLGGRFGAALRSMLAGLFLVVFLTFVGISGAPFFPAPAGASEVAREPVEDRWADTLRNSLKVEDVTLGIKGGPGIKPQALRSRD